MIHQSERITHLNVLNTFDSRDDVTNFSGTQLVSRHETQLVVTKFVNFVFAVAVHQPDGVTRFQCAVHHPALQNHTSILVEIGVEDEALNGFFERTLWWREMLNNSFQNLVNPLPCFG